MRTDKGSMICIESATMSRKGDWDCPKCGNDNFASRITCKRCDASRPATRPPVERRAGDWDCPKCGNDNFASRNTCKKCSASKPVTRPPVERKAGDWDCPTCGKHNFARNTQCFQCKRLAPSPESDKEGNCRVCMQRRADVMFEPCHHMYTCSECAIKISLCPMCRKDVTTRVRVFAE